ncbi:hypothetical protein H671_3g8606 [Cricetulus griseus]|nr:hypothetical protein H671_3g8606 [Cricetulus griseus]
MPSHAMEHSLQSLPRKAAAAQAITSTPQLQKELEKLLLRGMPVRLYTPHPPTYTSLARRQLDFARKTSLYFGSPHVW